MINGLPLPSPRAFQSIRRNLRACLGGLLLSLGHNAYAQSSPLTPERAPGPSVLFIGNSFTFAAGSPVQFYHPESVTDLNEEKQGGVPALFKAFAAEAGRDFQVSLETSPGKNLSYHLKEKAEVIGRRWDYVVLQGYSTLDKERPGDPAELVRSTKELATLLQTKNPAVDIRLLATWSRADQTYLKEGHWHGQPIDRMALDLRAGYDLAAASGGPAVHGVIPVGEPRLPDRPGRSQSL